jgi:putative transposase
MLEPVRKSDAYLGDRPVQDGSTLLHCRFVLQPVLRCDGQKGFVVLPRRWVVERTFAWLTQCRRLGKDYEVLPSSSEAMIYIALTRLMLRRLAAS